ncbi:MAG: META domain-containing protein [Candidatus Adiutrix sp.]|jgi:heat shock protein HslJ|nr:META domain-containing protein [Candidatus Adiutrix sp.]
MRKLTFFVLTAVFFGLGCQKAPVTTAEAETAAPEAAETAPAAPVQAVQAGPVQVAAPARAVAAKAISAAKKTGAAAREVGSAAAGKAEKAAEQVKDMTKTAAAKAKDASVVAVKAAREAGESLAGKAEETGRRVLEAVENSEGQAPDKNAAASEPAAEAGGREAWEQKLARRSFSLKSVDGRELNLKKPDGSEGPAPGLSFDEWPEPPARPFLSGKICNNYRGLIEIEGNILKMEKAAGTMMMCLDGELNRLENDFFKLLAEGVEMSLEDGTLTLKGQGRVLVFAAEN